MRCHPPQERSARSASSGVRRTAGQALVGTQNPSRRTASLPGGATSSPRRGRNVLQQVVEAILRQRSAHIPRESAYQGLVVGLPDVDSKYVLPIEVRTRSGPVPRRTCKHGRDDGGYRCCATARQGLPHCPRPPPSVALRHRALRLVLLQPSLQKMSDRVAWLHVHVRRGLFLRGSRHRPVCTGRPRGGGSLNQRSRPC